MSIPNRLSRFATGALVLSLGAVARAQSTERVSVDSSGNQQDGASPYPASLSADGRFVAFSSLATNLVSGDTNGKVDVFVRDRQARTTERVSVDSSGAEGDGNCGWPPAISADGRFVAFESDSSNLVPGTYWKVGNVFVRDRLLGTTELVSVDSSGNPGNSFSKWPSISADGRLVAFVSNASNLVAGDGNDAPDVFVHDRQTGVTERVSVDSAGVEGNLDSAVPAISADGRFVAFTSRADNLVPGDTNGVLDIFVHDRQAGTTERVSTSSAGLEADNWSDFPAISADGRFVAFESWADNLVAGDSNLVKDVFVRDRQTGTTERVSVDSAGAEGNGSSSESSISADGRLVGMRSEAYNLVSDSLNGAPNAFVHDRQTGTTQLANLSSAGVPGNQRTLHASLSADGRCVLLSSTGNNLVSGDTNHVADEFVHGPYLTLEADPPLAVAGATLQFVTWTGQSLGASLLVVTAINGTGSFIPVAPGSFDVNGSWALSGTVPAGLAGNVITFETVGFVPTGKVDVSNPFAVTFQ